MDLFEIILSASAVCLSGGAITYTVHVVRKTADLERPDDDRNILDLDCPKIARKGTCTIGNDAPNPEFGNDEI